MNLREVADLLVRVLPENTFRLDHQEVDIGIHLAKYKGKYTILIDVTDEGPTITVKK